MPIPDNIRARLEQLRMEAALRAEMERRQQQAQANAEAMAQKIPGKAEGGLTEFLKDSKVKHRVYHGTADDFSEFKYHPERAMGIWLAKEPDVASEYSGIAKRAGKNPSVMPLHVSLKNPANRAQYLAARKMAEAHSDKYGYADHNKRHREILQSQGFDGVDLGDAYIAFHPTQIKSAIGNRGTYDPTDPDITKAHGGPIHLAVGGQGPNNWLKGSVEPVIDPLLSKGVINNVNIPYGPKFDEARAKRIADLKNTASQPGYTGGAAKVAQHLEEDAKNPRQHEAALNQWVTSNLANYIRKQMATHDDPIRKLAEQGIVHMPPEQMGYGSSQADMVRKKLKAPRLGQSPEAQAWEDATDVSMYHTAAGDYMNTPREPWMEKADPETKVFRPTDNMHAHYLGFDHLVDILKQDLNEGRIRPEQLSKVSIEQAVRRAHEYDQERKKAMAQTALKATEGMPVHKDYGDGFKWLELAMPDKPLPEGYTPGGGNDKYVFDPSGNDVVHPNYQALQDALKYEGDTMGHCVGGYCPDVSSGKSRIFSLRDKNNEPHVTIEVRPQKTNDPSKSIREGVAPPELMREYQDAFSKSGQHSMHFASGFWPWLKDAHPDKFAEMTAEQPPVIQQIYGKSNKKPKDQYIPYVQDFVKGGNWSEVKTIQNAEMRDMNRHTGLSNWLSSKGVQHPRYLTEQEYGKHESDMLADKLGLDNQQGMAKGGEVKQPSLDTMRLALTKFLKPSKVKSRVYHGTESKDDYDDDDSGNDAIKSFSGRATWVAEEPYTAHGYSGKSGYVMPLHIRLTNPLKIDHIDANDEAHHVYSIAKSLGVDVDHLKSIADPERVWEVINHPYFIDAASKAGFDGISINEGGRKTHAVFDPGNIKSATGNRGTYDPSSPDITKAEGGKVQPSVAQMKLALNKQGMYSPLEKAAMAVPRSKGTPAEFMAEISKQPGFRKDEVEDRKISLPEQKMTKDEFLGHLKKHPAPLINEHLLGGNEMQEALDQMAQEIIGDEDATFDDLYGRDRDAALYDVKQNYGYDPETKYEDYALPGGDNYREVLLTLPSSGLSKNEQDQKMYLEATQRRGQLTPEHDVQLMKLQIKEQRAQPDYQSTHWEGHPNVLAHMRLSDRFVPNENGPYNVKVMQGRAFSNMKFPSREEAEKFAEVKRQGGYQTEVKPTTNKKILHVDEIQSDWHQQGRKEGYVKPLSPDEQQEFDALVSKERAGTATTDELRRMGELYHLHRSGVPDAPFKKNWHELALKHALGMAAKGGYHGIAITPGQQQADRYDLSKHVQNIYHSANADGTFHASVLSPRGQVLWEDFRAPPEKIEATLGKDIAHKIVNGVGEEENGMRRLDPEDMKVGGEGMKGFYDKIVPAYLNKLGKPHGAQVQMYGMPVNAPNQKSWGIEDAAKFHGMTGSEYLDHPDRPQLEKQFLQARQNQTADLHYFPITESMRQQIKQEGLPQYEQGGKVKGLDHFFESNNSLDHFFQE